MGTLDSPLPVLLLYLLSSLLWCDGSWKLLCMIFAACSQRGAAKVLKGLFFFRSWKPFFSVLGFFSPQHLFNHVFVESFILSSTVKSTFFTSSPQLNRTQLPRRWHSIRKWQWTANSATSEFPSSGPLISTKTPTIRRRAGGTPTSTDPG